MNMTKTPFFVFFRKSTNSSFKANFSEKLRKNRAIIHIYEKGIFSDFYAENIVACTFSFSPEHKVTLLYSNTYNDCYSPEYYDVFSVDNGRYLIPVPIFLNLLSPDKVHLPYFDDAIRSNPWVRAEEYKKIVAELTGSNLFHIDSLKSKSSKNFKKLVCANN